jgi:hypothetical protein
VIVELVTEVVEEEVIEAAEVLRDGFDGGGTVVITDDLVVEIAAPLPDVVVEAIPEGQPWCRNNGYPGRRRDRNRHRGLSHARDIESVPSFPKSS